MARNTRHLLRGTNFPLIGLWVEGRHFTKGAHALHFAARMAEEMQRAVQVFGVLIPGSASRLRTFFPAGSVDAMVAKPEAGGWSV
jgi:hypothetical protein